MSVIPIRYKIPYREQTLQTRAGDQRGFLTEEGTKRESQRLRIVCCSSTNEKQLKSVSLYLGKLRDNKCLDHLERPSTSFSPKKGLDVLDTYLEKLGGAAEKDSIYWDEEATKSFFTGKDLELENEGKLSVYNMRLDGLKSSQKLLQNDEEVSDLYLIGILASINIAVILFEIASPIKSSELELSTIPLLYGAKVNHLIIVGEWWRLVTPMFLHAGVFHFGLSCWSLGTFGPKVCRGYGWFTFLLIYILGGISGNLISFLHTPESTVGGTEPAYAIIGAWLIYQLQNKDYIPKEVSETMFQKAIIATGLGLILSHFCPIDEWAHFGAVFTGVAYGFVTCPTLQVDDSASRNGQDEGIVLVNRQSDAGKSLLLFSFFIFVLTLLYFFVEPPLGDLVPETFIQV